MDNLIKTTAEPFSLREDMQGQDVKHGGFGDVLHRPIVNVYDCK